MLFLRLPWQEWLQSHQNNKSPKYQYSYETEGDRTKTPIYSFVVKFPYRVFSNSGQDSIARPMLGKYGIPYIPGSSIKGLLKRLGYADTLPQSDKDLIKTYCGDEENPGKLRFHGAYPIGNWANQIVDVVHPQQNRQVKDNAAGSAFALLSFYEPEFAFEFSSPDERLGWPKVEALVKQSLSLGLGGKTSTGYGFSRSPDYANSNHPDYADARQFDLQGEGVSSLLLKGDPEFRPNLFKAALRGHLSRLLSGVCDSEQTIDRAVNRLFGSTEHEGTCKLFWQHHPSKLDFEPNNRPATYKTEGMLHALASSEDELAFLATVLKFAYTMGGFGKSWRRVWHKTFYRQYTKFAIGCHWQSDELSWVDSQTSLPNQLNQFLQATHQACLDRLNLTTATPLASWREAFHPNRVAVYCSTKPVTDSKAIRLFHNNVFKTTRAIGGRDPHREHPDKVKAPSYTSHVWHRILPVNKGGGDKDQYLEIVTVFHGGPNGNRALWRHRDHGDQLRSFTRSLEDQSMVLAWGNSP